MNNEFSELNPTQQTVFANELLTAIKNSPIAFGIAKTIVKTYKQCRDEEQRNNLEGGSEIKKQEKERVSANVCFHRRGVFGGVHSK